MGSHAPRTSEETSTFWFYEISGFGVEPIQNAVLLTSDRVMNQLLSRSSWHREMLRGVVNPWSVPDRVLESVDRYERTERVHYLRNDRSLSSGGTTCFRSAIVLG